MFVAAAAVNDDNAAADADMNDAAMNDAAAVIADTAVNAFAIDNAADDAISDVPIPANDEAAAFVAANATSLANADATAFAEQIMIKLCVDVATK